MSVAPVSGTSSAAQMALQQIRALRQGQPVQPMQAPAPAAAKTAAARPQPAQSQPLADQPLSNQLTANRPRGSLLNIVA